MTFTRFEEIFDRFIGVMMMAILTVALPAVLILLVIGLFCLLVGAR